MQGSQESRPQVTGPLKTYLGNGLHQIGIHGAGEDKPGHVDATQLEAGLQPRRRHRVATDCETLTGAIREGIRSLKEELSAYGVRAGSLSLLKGRGDRRWTLIG